MRYGWEQSRAKSQESRAEKLLRVRRRDLSDSVESRARRQERGGVLADRGRRPVDGIPDPGQDGHRSPAAVGEDPADNTFGWRVLLLTLDSEHVATYPVYRGRSEDP